MNAEVTLVSAEEVKSRGENGLLDRVKAIWDSVSRNAVERWTEATEEFSYRFQIARAPLMFEVPESSNQVRVLAGFCVAPTGAPIALYEGRNSIAIPASGLLSAAETIELTIHGPVAFIAQKNGGAETIHANRVLKVGTQKVLIKVLPERCRIEQSESIPKTRGNT